MRGERLGVLTGERAFGWTHVVALMEAWVSWLTWEGKLTSGGGCGGAKGSACATMCCTSTTPFPLLLPFLSTDHMEECCRKPREWPLGLGGEGGGWGVSALGPCCFPSVHGLCCLFNTGGASKPFPLHHSIILACGLPSICLKGLLSDGEPVSWGLTGEW